LSLLVLLWMLSASVQAQDEEREEALEYLSLAALLIGDGNYTRAQQVLASVDLDDEALDRIRYHTLSGLVALNLSELPRAVSEFEAAIAAGQTEPVVWLYLAQAHFGQQQYAETLTALDQAGVQATQLPSVFMMRSQAHWELGEYENAWQVLGQGRAQFPDRAGDFARRQVFLLVDQGLYQEAAEQGRLFLDTQQAGTDDAIAIGNALRQSGQYQEAARILELARLTAPDNVTLAQVLSHTYVDQDMLLPAADVMKQAAAYDPELIAEAAELYRRANWLMQALTLNGQVIDQSRKLKQRLAILVEMGRFDQAAAMQSDLTRVGLLSDEDIRYALAFALFRVGEYEAAESHLVQLTRADLFRKATELRRVMEQCAEEPWLCA
ncbi:MAG: hypothetical protein AAGH65_03140, partial [Pseudomonadota bacterium]